MKGMEIANILLNDEDHNFARDIVMTHCSSHNNYEIYRNIVQLNTTYNKIAETEYKPVQKKRIEDFIRNKSVSVTGYRSWNKDFTKCAWITISDEKPLDSKNLQLTIVGLVNDGKRVTYSSKLWQEFCFPVFEDDVCPFFDKDGRACFYGFRGFSSNFSNDILEFSIDLNDMSKCCCCWYLFPLRTEWGDQYASFMEILNFPLLIRSILQSKQIEEKKMDDVLEELYERKHYIRWVTLPDDYKTFKQHTRLESEFTSYDCLPVDSRQAFDERYQEQQHDKKMIENKKKDNSNDEGNDIS
jgi:hypothetical protein